MIVAAAERAGCQQIWSEDLNTGQKYFGVTVMNPFHKRDRSVGPFPAPCRYCYNA